MPILSDADVGITEPPPRPRGVFSDADVGIASAPVFGSDEYVNALSQKYGADPDYVRGMLGAQTNSEALKGVPVAGAFVDKAGAGLSALANPVTGAGISGDTISDRYAKNLKLVNEISADFEREHPNLTTASNLIGGTLALAPVGATTAGARLLGLTGKSLLTRMATGAASGGAVGGADAAARGEDPSRGAAVGIGTGFLGPVAGRIVGKIAEAVRSVGSPGIALPTAEEIGDAASKAYKAPEIQAIQFQPQAVQSLADNIRGDLNSGKFNVRRAPQTHGLLDDLAEPINGTSHTIEDLETTRQMLGKVAGNFTNPADQTAAIRAKQMIDNYLAKVPQADLAAGDADAANAALTNARANYAVAKRMDTVSGKVDAAENQAAVANSGQNIDNATRQRINDILKSPKLRSGYLPQEIVAMQQVARGTAPGNVLRFVGNLLGGGGGLGSIASGTVGFAAGGPPGAVLAPVTGYLVKKAGNALTNRNVNNLMNVIASRAPVAQSAVAARAAAVAAQRQRLLQAMGVGGVVSRAAVPAFGSPGRGDQ